MIDNLHESINAQQEKLKKGNPEIQLVAPCTLGNGIIKPPRNLQSKKINGTFSWFIPASGSGSRMFQFLYDFIENQDNENEKIKLFLQKLESFAFYSLLDKDEKTTLLNKGLDKKELIENILYSPKLNLGKMPKGLLPFHRKKEIILNAFQEQVLQGIKLGYEPMRFHFTIQREFENEIIKSIQAIDGISGCEIHLSEQEKSTDSIAFDQFLQPIKQEDNKILTRPSGHGALLKNMNQVEADFLLIKNIDNIQHLDKSESAIAEWKNLIELTHLIRNQLVELYNNPTLTLLNNINKEYHLFSNELFQEQLTIEKIRELINKPLRICGMVKNVGQPGGGSFWVRKSGKLTKQIVEKAQISENEAQIKILNESSHFNPVMIVASVKDYDGKKYDLTKYCDEESYFIVHKTHEGKKIQYIEKPGLWNGSMAQWLTVFVEIPSDVFSPVKTILDLLEPSHLAEN